MPEDNNNNDQNGGGGKKDSDFVATSVHNDLKSKYDQLDQLNANVVEERNTLKNKLDAFEGIDPEEYRSMKQQLQDHKVQNSGGNPEEVQALLTEREDELRTELGSEIEKRDQRIQALEEQIQSQAIQTKVMDTIGGLFNDDCHTFIRDMANAESQISDDGEVVFIDEKGNRRASLKNPAKLLTIDEWGAEKVEKYPSMAKTQQVNQGSIRNGVVPRSAQSQSGDMTLEQYQRIRGSLSQSERYKRDREFGL